MPLTESKLPHDPMMYFLPWELRIQIQKVCRQLWMPISQWVCRKNMRKGEILQMLALGLAFNFHSPG